MGEHTKVDLDEISGHFEDCLANEFAESVKTDDYVLAYRGLNKIFDQLGSIFAFVKDDIESKCIILEKHNQGPDAVFYKTILSMAKFEILHGLIGAKEIKVTNDIIKENLNTLKDDLNNIMIECNKEVKIGTEKSTNLTSNQLPSGTRSLLKLHRAMYFISFLFPALLKSDPSKISSIRNIITSLYDETLAKFHTWIVRKAVHLALLAACPSREKLLSLVHYESMDDLRKKCERLSLSSEKVLKSVQKIYENHGILDLS